MLEISSQDRAMLARQIWRVTLLLVFAFLWAGTARAQLLKITVDCDAPAEDVSNSFYNDLQKALESMERTERWLMTLSGECSAPHNNLPDTFNTFSFNNFSDLRIVVPNPKTATLKQDIVPCGNTLPDRFGPVLQIANSNVRMTKDGSSANGTAVQIS